MENDIDCPCLLLPRAGHSSTQPAPAAVARRPRARLHSRPAATSPPPPSPPARLRGSGASPPPPPMSRRNLERQPHP